MSVVRGTPYIFKARSFDISSSAGLLSEIYLSTFCTGSWLYLKNFPILVGYAKKYCDYFTVNKRAKQ